MGLLACWVFGANLGGWRTLGTHEALAAVPARAMAAGGDLVVPDFGGVPRVKKPPLGYWLIAAAGSLGGGVTAFTARSPSAASAVLLCGVVGWWGGRWYGRRAGVGAALVQATSLWAVTYGRKAEVDMTLALLTTCGLAVILTAPPGESAGRTKLRWIAVWAVAGVGWLGKFHFVPVLLFGPLAVHLVLARRWGELRGAAGPVGIAAFAALAAPWPLLVAVRVPEAADAWAVQVGGRAAGGLGVRPLWFYPRELLTLSLPWTPLWVAAAWFVVRRHAPVAVAAWRGAAGRRLDRRTRAAWRAVAGRGDAARRRFDRDLFPPVWVAVTVAILSVSLGRNRHYLLPALPVLSLLAGRAAAVSFQLAVRGRTFGGRLRGRWAAAAAGAGGAGLAAAAGVAFHVVVPAADDRAIVAAFVRSLPDRTAPGEPLVLLGLGESSALWHLPPAARRTPDAAALARVVRAHGSAAVLTDDRAAWRLDRLRSAWRAAGGTLRIEPLAREEGRAPASPGRPPRFEPLRGLRFVRVSVERQTRRTVQAGGGRGVVLR